MTWVRIIQAVALIAAMPFWARAQTEAQEVVGQVVRVQESGQSAPAPGRMVWLRGMQRFVFTQADGRFKLNQTEQQYRRGQLVEVVVNQPGWQIFDPVGGRITWPETQGGRSVVLRMAPLGHSVFLSDAAVSLFLREAVFESSPPSPGTPSSSPSAVQEAMGSWAQKYGVSLSQVQAALDSWIARRRDGHFAEPDERCLWLFTQGDLAKSAACFAEPGQAGDSETEPLVARSAAQAERLLLHYYRSLYLSMKLQDLTGADSALQRAARRITRDVAPSQWAMLRQDHADQLRFMARSQDGEQARALLERSVAAYRDALSVYTQASLPGQWADLQLQLGIVLCRLALVSSPERRAPILEESAAALRLGLLIFSRERYPEQWANLQDWLAQTRMQQAKLVEGEQRDTLLREAQSLLRAVTSVRTRQQAPAQYAAVMLDLGGVCLALSDRACAVASALAAYATDPKNHGIYAAVTTLLQEKMFDAERALAIHRDHAARYPEAEVIWANLAETQLQVGRFAEARQQIACLIETTDPALRAALLALQVMLQLIEGQVTDYERALRGLRDWVAAQKAEFQVRWNFDSTAHFVRTKVRSESSRTRLLALIEALRQKDRDSILAGIDALPRGEQLVPIQKP